MSEQAAEQIEAILKPLLRTLETLFLIGRHLNPPEVAGMLAQVGFPDRDLSKVRSEAQPWPEALSALGAQLDAASDEAIAALEGLRASAMDPGSVRELFSAMRHLPRALEALYPTAGVLASVNRFFLGPGRRKDGDFQTRFLKPPAGNTGVIRFGEDPDARATVWVYVPETYSPEVAHPLVVALHGGGGRGRSFLWSWVREARSRGAIVVAPTSLGATWAIQGEDIDSPNLAAVVGIIGESWTIDAKRILLTGMSDGGTFAYVSGLDSSSPFTHLAPVAAAFHPLLAQMADKERLRGLPIHIIHGRLDWMFPVTMARNAEHYFRAAGAAVTYLEVADLSHTYPTDMNEAILAWLIAKR